MLKRNIGDFVVINPYADATGIIIETRENNDGEFNSTFDYKVKWNQPMEDGFEWQYFDDEELDRLKKNWDMVKESQSS